MEEEGESSYRKCAASGLLLWFPFNHSGGKAHVSLMAGQSGDEAAGFINSLQCSVAACFERNARLAASK